MGRDSIASEPRHPQDPGKVFQLTPVAWRPNPASPFRFDKPGFPQAHLGTSLQLKQANGLPNGTSQDAVVQQAVRSTRQEPRASA
jgi:hypothetical protein